MSRKTTATRHQLESLDAVRTFATGGKAKLTAVIVPQDKRYTYRVKAGKKDGVYFVDLLTAPDNERSYTSLGWIKGGRFDTCRWAKVSAAAHSFRVFARIWEISQSAGPIPPALEVWHEGKCCRCGRTLTVPTSIASGIGPECAKRIGAKQVDLKAARFAAATERDRVAIANRRSETAAVRASERAEAKRAADAKAHQEDLATATAMLGGAHPNGDAPVGAFLLADRIAQLRAG